MMDDVSMAGMDFIRSFAEALKHFIRMPGGSSAILPYVIACVAVGIIPLILAGIGGHLATLALPEHSRSKARWKFLVWSLAVLGVGLFIYSQSLSYHADKERDANQLRFQSQVLGKLDDIANEPSRRKRQDAVARLAATLIPDLPVAPTSNHPPKLVDGTVSPSVASVFPKAQVPLEPTTSIPSSAPSSSSVAACPPPGQLVLLWNIASSKEFFYDVDPSARQSLHPALLGVFNPEFRVMLDSTQFHNFDVLAKDIQPFLPKAQPIETKSTTVTPNAVLTIATHDFRQVSVIRYSYDYELNGNHLIGGASTIPVANLSSGGRHAVQDLDDLAQFLADRACADALDKLTTKR